MLALKTFIRHRKLSRIGRGSYVVILIAGLFFVAADYARFIDKIKDSDVSNETSEMLPQADAVVVLTGGAKRISTGVQLLKANHGRRLLISGVSATTSRSDIGKVLDDSAMMYGCCIDLDRKALDTRGNAVHTANWVELHNFRKILLVTSSYHMPRSLMLLEERMPDVQLVAVPIQPPNWENLGFFDLMLSPVVLREYAKYRISAFGIEPSVRRISSAFLRASTIAKS